MILTDQPNCFNETVVAAVSSKDDGQMQLGWVESDDEVISNRSKFLKANNLEIDRTVLVKVKYHDKASYDIIRQVSEHDSGSGMMQTQAEPADCLITTTKNLGLFVPIADCIATVFHDSKNNVLALAHIGRHSTVANLASKTIEFMKNKYNSDTKDINIWMSPSIRAESYTLKHVDFVKNNDQWNGYYKKTENGYLLDMQGYNKNQLVQAGVNEQNIHISDINTATDANYWSHYTSVSVQSKPAPPRFAVVCALK